jgi:uncharacterized protein with PhoU and TrkA domain
MNRPMGLSGSAQVGKSGAGSVSFPAEINVQQTQGVEIKAIARGQRYTALNGDDEVVRSGEADRL